MPERKEGAPRPEQPPEPEKEGSEIFNRVADILGDKSHAVGRPEKRESGGYTLSKREDLHQVSIEKADYLDDETYRLTIEGSSGNFVFDITEDGVEEYMSPSFDIRDMDDEVTYSDHDVPEVLSYIENWNISD